MVPGNPGYADNAEEEICRVEEKGGKGRKKEMKKRATSVRQFKDVIC